MAGRKAGRPPGPRTPAEIAADVRRTGRPPKGKESRRVSRFSLNMTERDFEGLKACAKLAGLSMSAYLVRLWKQTEDYEKWRTSIKRSGRG